MDNLLSIEKPLSAKRKLTVQGRSNKRQNKNVFSPIFKTPSPKTKRCDGKHFEGDEPFSFESNEPFPCMSTSSNPPSPVKTPPENCLKAPLRSVDNHLCLQTQAHGKKRHCDEKPLTTQPSKKQKLH